MRPVSAGHVLTFVSHIYSGNQIKQIIVTLIIKVNSDPADETIIEVYSIYLLIFQSNRVYSGFSAILF